MNDLPYYEETAGARWKRRGKYAMAGLIPLAILISLSGPPDEEADVTDKDVEVVVATTEAPTTTVELTWGERFKAEMGYDAYAAFAWLGDYTEISETSQRISTELGYAAETFDLEAVGAGCRELLAIADRRDEVGSPPHGGRMASLYEEITTLLRRGSISCLDGVEHFDPDAIEVFLDHLNRVTDLQQELVAEMDAEIEDIEAFVAEHGPMPA